MTYKHLNQSARDRIEVLLEAGHTQTEIASVLKVNRSTISREIQNRKRMDDRYDADLADHKAYVKRLYSKYQGMKIEGNDKLRTHVIAELKLKRSPDEIAGRLNQDAGWCVVNHKAIYKWLYTVYGDRYCHLLCTKRRRIKKRNPDKQPKVMIPNLVSIHAIPREMIQCEGDTFVSPKRYQTTASVAVVVEKISKLILAKKISNLKPRVMARTMKTFNQQMDIANIVLDRGIENRYHEQFGMSTYFCDPQSPHQKPLVEGSIGLMRRWFWKKGTNLAMVSHQEIQKCVAILNHKYRKSLHYRSAYEVAQVSGILKEKQREATTESCT